MNRNADDKVIVSKTKLDALADAVNSKTGVQGALTIK